MFVREEHRTLPRDHASTVAASGDVTLGVKRDTETELEALDQVARYLDSAHEGQKIHLVGMLIGARVQRRDTPSRVAGAPDYSEYSMRSAVVELDAAITRRLTSGRAAVMLGLHSAALSRVTLRRSAHARSRREGKGEPSPRLQQRRFAPLSAGLRGEAWVFAAGPARKPRKRR